MLVTPSTSEAAQLSFMTPGKFNRVLTGLFHIVWASPDSSPCEITRFCRRPAESRTTELPVTTKPFWKPISGRAVGKPAWFRDPSGECSLVIAQCSSYRGERSEMCFTRKCPLYFSAVADLRISHLKGLAEHEGPRQRFDRRPCRHTRRADCWSLLRSWSVWSASGSG